MTQGDEGLTFPQLEAELRSALQRLEEQGDNESSDQENATAVLEELAQREQEIKQLRDEIARLKERNEPDGRRVAVGTSMRLLTPPPFVLVTRHRYILAHLEHCSTERLAPSSAGSSRAVPARHTIAPLHGVTRTLSGSLISNLTRRPTPEPSDSGSQDAEIGELVFDSVQDDFSPFSGDQGHDDAASAMSTGPATPQPTPQPNLLNHDMNHATKRTMTNRHVEEVCACS